jgi:hypothetical protein
MVNFTQEKFNKRKPLFKTVFLCRETKADTLKQLRPIGKGDQELEKRLDQKELT